MLKKLSIFILVFAAFILVSCDSATSDVVISKVYTTAYQSDNLLELYNPSEEVVKLSNHELYFYSNGSQEVSVKIKLTGEIAAKGYFVIGSNQQTISSVKPLIDFTYEDGPLPFNGNDAIELRVSGKAHDLVGTIGMDLDFSRNQTMIRLGNPAEFKPDASYTASKFISYKPEAFNYLKNELYQIKTLEQLLEGPRIEERYHDLDYVDPTNPTVGGGGTALVTLQSIADGDTATFRAGNGYPGGSMRYFYIDTPEVNGAYVIAAPWGYVASKFNKEYLLNDATSKEIIVQSIPGYALQEGNGRNLGLVWINGHLSQFLIVKEGLSDDVSLTFSNYDTLLTYKDVPYLTFLKFAEEYARSQGWGMHGYPGNPDGEKSPDWNYQANNGTGGLATTNPTWEPHNPLPW